MFQIDQNAALDVWAKVAVCALKEAREIQPPPVSGKEDEIQVILRSIPISSVIGDRADAQDRQPHVLPVVRVMYLLCLVRHVLLRLEHRALKRRARRPITIDPASLQGDERKIPRTPLKVIMKLCVCFIYVDSQAGIRCYR